LVKREIQSYHRRLQLNKSHTDLDRIRFLVSPFSLHRLLMSESSDDEVVGPPIPIASIEDDEDVGPSIPVDIAHVPKKARTDTSSSVQRQESLDSRLPMASLYEKSFMHRDQVTQIHVSIETDFIITVSASGGGTVKFWKKVFQGIEFVKSFSCGSNIVDSVISSSGRELSVLSGDKYVRFFDIESFTMFGMAKLGERMIPNFSLTNSRLCLISQPSLTLCVSVAERIHVLNVSALLEDPKSYSSQTPRFTHTSRVTHIKSLNDFVVSVDDSGFIEVWKLCDSSTLSKFDTDLFELKKRGTTMCLSLAVGRKKFAVLASNPNTPSSPLLFVFNLPSCRLTKTIDETLDSWTIAQNDPLQSMVHLDASDFANRIGQEMERKPNGYVDGLAFDDSEDFLIYSSVVGVKVVDLTSNSLVHVLGKYEKSERFFTVKIFQGKPQRRILETTGDSAIGSEMGESDPLILATSVGSDRFFVFSNRMPRDDRDVFNEEGGKPSGKPKTVLAVRAPTLPTKATIVTTSGDIQIELFPVECPRTVENFSTHARNGYYDNCVFHRVVKGFMIQTGDAVNGDGTGGESIWGGEFADEIDVKKRNHKKPLMVSMANHGVNTNGSQFFITTVATPWLDGKHTVFGQVMSGTDTVKAIENVDTGDQDRPVKDIRILEIKIR